MNEHLETYNLCLELCSVIREKIAEAIVSEGKDDAFVFYSGNISDTAKTITAIATEEWSERQALPYQWNIFTEYGMDSSVVESFFKNGRTDQLAIYIMTNLAVHDVFCYSNSMYQIHSIANGGYGKALLPDSAPILKKLELAQSIADNMEAALRFFKNKNGDWRDVLVSEDDSVNIFTPTYYESLKKKMKDILYADMKLRYQNDWGYTQPPFSKEPWPKGIPTLAGVILGVIAGLLINESTTSQIADILPAALPILLGGGAFAIISMINSKEEKDYKERVKNCNDSNDRKLREFADDIYSRLTTAAFDYMIENIDTLEFAMGNLATSAHKILSGVEFDFLPDDYRYDANVLGIFVNYFKNKRVSTIQEAVNLYIAERDEAEYRRQMAMLEEKRIAQEARDAALRRQNEAERNALIAQLSDAVGELRRSNDEAEAKRRTDAEELKSMLSDAQRREEKLKNDLSDAKGTLNDIKKQLDF